MIRKWFTGCVLACVLLPLGAQQDPQAKEILDRAGKQVEQAPSLHLEFTLTTIDQQNNTEESREGELYLKKEKYRLNFLDTESYFNGKTLWSYLPDMNEVSITEPDPEESFFFSNPSKLFSGYDKEYKYLYLGTEEETGHHLIDLVPMELNQEYSKIRISVDPANSQLVRAHYFGKDGIHHVLKIHSYDSKTNRPDSFFTFDPKKFPGVEVIDMRF